MATAATGASLDTQMERRTGLARRRAAMLRNTAIALAAGSLFATIAPPTNALSSSWAFVMGSFLATCPIAGADVLAQQKFRAGIDSSAAHRRAAVQKTSNDLAGFADVVEAVKSAVIGV